MAWKHRTQASRGLALAGLLALICVFAIPGCATMGPRLATLVPTRFHLDTGPYRIATSEPLGVDAPAVQALMGLERQVCDSLRLPHERGEEPIEVYILDDRATFNHFLKFYYPELPPRRAFFLAQGPRRVIYTYKGNDLEIDLRHEAFHALIHGRVANLPLWLDEGLAEYFEDPSPPTGVNHGNLERAVAEAKVEWAPDLKRLESLDDVRRMSPRDYREAWAWVDYLMNASPGLREGLIDYIHAVPEQVVATPLSDAMPELCSEDASEALFDHLDRRVEEHAQGVRQRVVKARAQGDALDVGVARAAATKPGRREGFSEKIRRVGDFSLTPFRMIGELFRRD